MTRVDRGSLLALLGAEVISATGSGMTQLALPWFVLATTGSPARMSMVIAAEMLAVAILGIPGGALAARLGSRRMMLSGDLLRCGLIMIIPALYLLDALSFGLLLLVAFAVGAVYAPYQASQVVILPDLVGDDDALLARANALLLGANRVTTLLAAPAAGVLIGVFGSLGVLWIDAASFFAAFALVALFVPSGQRVPEADDAKGLFAGVRTLFKDAMLRPWTLSISGFEMAWQIVFAAIPVLAFLYYDRDPRVAGLLFGAFAAGALLGNVVVFPLLRSISPLRMIVIGKVPQALAFWVLVVDSRAVTVGAVLFFTGFCTGLIGGPTAAVQTNRIPPALRAKAMSAFVTISLLAGALGLVAAAPLMQAANVTSVFVLVALLHSVGTFFFVSAAIRAAPATDPAAHREPEPVHGHEDP
jgi:MFS family permease